MASNEGGGRASRWWAWLVALGVLATAAVAIWLAGADTSVEPGGGNEEVEGPPEEALPEELGWLLDDPQAPSSPRDRTRPGGGEARPWGPGERGAGRGRGRGRWGGDGGAEERRAWLRRRINIVPLGATPPTIAPEQVAEAMREHRQAFRDCIEAAGGFEGFRALMRGDAGAAGQRTLSFDIAPNGDLAEGSLAMEPPMPEPIAGCFSRSFDSVQFESPGPDGARVEMQMGRPRGRGGRGGGDPSQMSPQ